MLTAVAAPPMLSVVTPVFSKLNVPAEEVISPPFTATSPPAVTFPVSVEIPSTVSVPFVWMFPALFTLSPVEP